MKRLQIRDYIDVKFVNLYKQKRGLYDLEIARRMQKFQQPMDNSHIAKVLTQGRNCELDTLIKLCYTTGMTPNDIVAGDWEGNDVELLKADNIKLQDEKMLALNEVKALKKEIVAYRKLESFLKFKEVI